MLYVADVNVEDAVSILILPWMTFQLKSYLLAS